MNIPDEYFTDEVPTDPGFDYLVKWPRSGAITYMPGQQAVGCVPIDPPLRFFRLAQVAELERLKAENEKLRERVKRLEDAGDELYQLALVQRGWTWSGCEYWREAKEESKP